MYILLSIILLFLLFYLTGSTEFSLIAIVLLSIPLASKFKKLIPTPAFYILIGFVVGIFRTYTDSILLKDLFDIATLFLAFSAGSELTNKIGENNIKNVVKYALPSSFLIVVVFFAVMLFFIKNIAADLAVATLFLAISPITVYILMQEFKIGERNRDFGEANVIVRDIIQILAFSILIIFTPGTAGISFTLPISILAGVIAAFFLVLLLKFKAEYSFLYMIFIFTLALFATKFLRIEPFVASLIMGMGYSFIYKGNRRESAVEKGSHMLYPFLYVYIGIIFMHVPYIFMVLGLILLAIKLFTEFLTHKLFYTPQRLSIYALLIPVAGASLPHLFIIKRYISTGIFDALLCAIILSELTGPFILTLQKRKL